MSVDRLRQASFLIVVLASLGILFAPASAVPSGPQGVDTVVHVALFAVLAYTLLLVGSSRRTALIVLLGYAAASELIQTVPALNRSGSVVDWLADAVGIGAGVVLSLVLRRPVRWWAVPR